VRARWGAASERQAAEVRSLSRIFAGASRCRKARTCIFRPDHPLLPANMLLGCDLGDGYTLQQARRCIIFQEVWLDLPGGLRQFFWPTDSFQLMCQPPGFKPPLSDRLDCSQLISGASQGVRESAFPWGYRRH